MITNPWKLNEIYVAWQLNAYLKVGINTETI